MLDRDRIAASLLGAPITARLALTVRHPRLREAAARRIADLILDGDRAAPDRDQLALPL